MTVASGLGRDRRTVALAAPIEAGPLGKNGVCPAAATGKWRGREGIGWLLSWHHDHNPIRGGKMEFLTEDKDQVCNYSLSHVHHVFSCWRCPASIPV